MYDVSWNMAQNEGRVMGVVLFHKRETLRLDCRGSKIYYRAFAKMSQRFFINEEKLFDFCNYGRADLIDFL